MDDKDAANSALGQAHEQPEAPDCIPPMPGPIIPGPGDEPNQIIADAQWEARRMKRDEVIMKLATLYYERDRISAKLKAKSKQIQKFEDTLYNDYIDIVPYPIYPQGGDDAQGQTQGKEESPQKQTGVELPKQTQL